MFSCGDYLGGVFLQCQGIALLQLRDCIGWITAVCRGNAVDLVFDAVSVSAGTLANVSMPLAIEADPETSLSPESSICESPEFSCPSPSSSVSDPLFRVSRLSVMVLLPSTAESIVPYCFQAKAYCAFMKS